MFADPQVRYRLIAAALFLAGILVLAFALAAPSAAAARDSVLAVAGLTVLIIPGFGIAWALRPSGEIRTMELVVGGGALALGLLAIGGIVLNVLPMGLTRWTWLGLVAVALASVWAFAADREPGSTHFPGPARFTSRDTLLLVAAVVVVIAAIVVARIGAEGTSESFSQLWLLRQPATGVSARIGVQSEETATTGYRVALLVDGSQIQTWSITLQPGQRWTVNVARSIASGSQLEVRLFRDTQPAVAYRQVLLWGPLSPPAAGGTG